MTLNPLLKTSITRITIKILMGSFVSLLTLTACDRNASHRGKPARTVAPNNQKTNPLTRTDENPAARSSNSRLITPSSSLEDRANDDTLRKTNAGPSLLPRGSSTTTSSATTTAPVTSTSTAGTPNNTVNPSSPNQTGTINTNPLENKDNRDLKELQSILAQLGNMYLNAWYSITKDNTSKPRNFFEDVALKMQNLTPIITLKPGQRPPSSLRDHCERYRVVHTIDDSEGRQRLLLYDCSSRQYATILGFKKSGTSWDLATTPQALEQILPNQLGYLSTIPYKPVCKVEVNQETEKIRLLKAQCSEWGQEMAAKRSRDRKTIFFTQILFDNNSTNVLKTEAQFVDYDGSNQLCRSGLMKRIAPQSEEVIYVDDEGDGQCQRTATTEPKQNLPVQTNSSAETPPTPPRVRVVETPPKEEHPVEPGTDIETGEILPKELVPESMNVSPTTVEDENSEAAVTTVTPETPEAATPPEQTPQTPEPAENLKGEDSEQIDFSTSPGPILHST